MGLPYSKLCCVGDVGKAVGFHCERVSAPPTVDTTYQPTPPTSSQAPPAACEQASPPVVPLEGQSSFNADGCSALLSSHADVKVPQILLSSKGLDAGGQEALARLGMAGTLQGLTPAHKSLSDVKLTHVLGAGGYAVVFAGLWQGHSPVAVKLCATGATLEEGLPAQVLTEAVLSKGLSHPNIVRTHAVRCSVLTPAFLGRVFPPPSTSPLSSSASVDAAALGQFLGRDGQPQLQAGLRRPDIPERRAGHPQQPLAETGAEAFHTASTTPVHTPAAPSLPRRVYPVSSCEMRGPVRLTRTASSSVVWDPDEGGGDTGLTPLNAEDAEASGASSPDQGGRQASTDEFELTDDRSHMIYAQALSWADVLTHVKGWSAGHAITIIIMEWARMGSLWQAIKMGVFDTRREASDARFSAHLRLRALLKTAREVATALAFLHDSGIAHGDVKPANILLSESRVDCRGFTATLGDFGLSKVLGRGAGRDAAACVAGTLPFLAPELLVPGATTSFAADMYAYGITLWEMASRQAAYQGVDHGVVKVHVQLGGRPQWPSWVPCAELRDIYDKCVSDKPEERPTASQVLDLLSEAERSAKAAYKAARSGSYQPHIIPGTYPVPAPAPAPVAVMPAVARRP